MRTTAAVVLFALALTLMAPVALSATPAMAYKAAAFIPEDFREFDKKRDKEATRLYKAGRKAYRDGRYRDAIKELTALTQADPADTQARLFLAYAFLKDQNYQSCYDEALELLRRHPTLARAHSLAGAALLRSGYIPNAIQMLNQAFKIDMKDALAYGAAAEIDYYEGRARDSIAKAFRAFHLDPMEPDFLITIARASARVELYEQAAEAYHRFLDIAPKEEKERRDRIKGLIQFYQYLAGLKVHEISGPREVDIPFALGSDRRPYIKLKINGKDATFVIDTGSGFTVISKEAAKKFGINEIARGGHSQGVGGEGKFPIIYGLLRQVQLGDLKLRSIPCFIRPFHTPRDLSKDGKDSLHADGFIGLSVLSRFITELDYKDRVMRLDQQVTQTLPVIAEAGTTVVPFRTTQNGLISIETELDDKNVINAILDSGASSTVISTAAVKRLNLREQIIKGQTVRVIGAGGISDNVELLYIRNCRVANLKQENLRALILNFDAINETSGFEQSGILGGDFLRHFSVTLDFQRGQIVLRPYTTSIKKLLTEEKNQNGALGRFEH